METLEFSLTELHSVVTAYSEVTTHSKIKFNLLNYRKTYNLRKKPVILLDGSFPEKFISFKKQYKKQSGIYGWIHKKSLKTYVGSAIDLTVRLFRHLYNSTKTNTYLKNALKKDGLHCFVLLVFKILGNVEKISNQELRRVADSYLAAICNKYNLLEKAYISKGYKHTVESLQKIREKRLGRTLSEEIKEKLRKQFSGELNPFFGRKHSSL